MIDEIQVENLALISSASLVPDDGLTVLTGETGAGKTALLNALRLLMGERADKSLVRDGKPELSVSGRFYLRPDEMSAEADLEEHVAVRRVTADGRSRVTLDGRMAGVTELADIVGPSVDLCSQHENQQLMRPATHAALLDAWIGEAALSAKAAYQEAWDCAAQAAAALANLQDLLGAQDARLDQARFILRRIDEVNPQEGEYEELVAELSRAEHAEALATATDTAYTALSGEGGAVDALQEAAAALENAAAHDASLGGLAATLREAEAAASDVAGEARRYRDDLDFDAETLLAHQQRVAAMQGLLRQYGPRMVDVFATRAQAADMVSAVDDADLRLEQAARAAASAEAALARAQAALADVRAEAAPRFAEAVTVQMRRLEMGSAQVVCQAEDLPRERWTRAGGQAIEFLFRSGAGLAARPLARIASGGEVSRVMLAVKVVLGEKDAVDTLVFDEIDVGVGGATALAIADVLADLARTHQVLVVTHLAQVAAKASRHYLVEKSAGDVPETHLRVLSDDERVAELARMLGGTVTEASLAHARELLG